MMEPSKSDEEIQHESSVNKAFKRNAFFIEIGLFNMTDAERIYEMLRSDDREAQLLGIAFIDRAMLDLSTLVEMYKAGLAHKPEGEK